MNGFDVCVRGRGAVGLSLALELGRRGLRVALVGEPVRADAGPDVRTYALNAASIELLSQLKVWDALRATPGAATRVIDMQVRGDANGELGFSAWQQGVAELAWIVDAAALERELAQALRFAPHVDAVESEVDAPLLALCEGKDSATRAALGIEIERHDYGQTAIAARLASDEPNQGVARQWFRAPDVLALLPFDAADGRPGYGLVWSLPTDRAQALLALDAGAFDAELNAACGPVAGTLTLASERAAWPLRLAGAKRWFGALPGRKERAWVLLGDAAHVVHPLAGQGLNLGLADVAALSRVLGARETWRSLSDERLLGRYARERAGATWAMGRMTDTLVHLFARPDGALAELRNRGLTLVDHAAPIKRWLAARALRG